MTPWSPVSDIIMLVTIMFSSSLMMTGPMAMVMTGPMAMCLQVFTLYPGVTLRPEASL